MQQFAEIAPLKRALTAARQAGHSIGFVPTMGALHEGHAALLRRARAENPRCVCSIFVNPTQFNEADDLKAYPRTPEKDAALLQRVGTDVLFLPTVSEIYPPGRDLSVPVDFGPLLAVMEARFRPGHFDGVAMVVRRLFDIVAPNRAYFGEKDYQQLALIRHMVKALALPVEIVGCPTVREADGLAMSSRNRRLSPADRQRAPAIFQTLQWARQQAAATPAPAIRDEALQRLERAGLRPEYFEIVAPDTLLPLGPRADARTGRACTAAWAGPVRLIDNLALG